MDETKPVVFRRFFLSSEKEMKWLNGLGSRGYHLESRKEHQYRFTLREGSTWYYLMEWMDRSAESDPMRPYLEQREAEGAEVAAVWSCWVYFASEKPLARSREMLRRTAKHYLYPALWFVLFAAIAAALLVYHIGARDLLRSNGVLLTTPKRVSADNPIVRFCRRLIYGGEVLIYYYGQFWARFFGNTKATLVIGVLIPLIAVLLVLAAFRLTEWLRIRAVLKGLPQEPDREASLAENAPCGQTPVVPPAPAEGPGAYSEETEELKIAEQEVSEENHGDRL